jgi:hypothetical protein
MDRHQQQFVNQSADANYPFVCYHHSLIPRPLNTQAVTNMCPDNTSPSSRAPNCRYQPHDTRHSTRHSTRHNQVTKYQSQHTIKYNAGPCRVYTLGSEGKLSTSRLTQITHLFAIHQCPNP